MPTEAEAAAAALAAAKPWHDGKADAETLGHWQNKGWDPKDPGSIAIAATKAHREAERLIGAPASELIRMPKVGDEAGIKAMWQRLGVPADPKEYDFVALKFSDGKVTDEALDATLRASFSKVNIPKDAAASLAADIVKHFNGVKAAGDAELTANLAKEREALAKNWGTNEPANKLTATRAAAALGVGAEEIAALEKIVGYAKTMEMFRNIGSKIGEAKFIGGDQDKPGIMSREQAIAKKGELMADTEWVKRYTAGGMKSAEFRELEALLTIIGG